MAAIYLQNLCIFHSVLLITIKVAEINNKVKNKKHGEYTEKQFLFSKYIINIHCYQIQDGRRKPA